jgi:osmoprotectant transport system permease protein
MSAQGELAQQQSGVSRLLRYLPPVALGWLVVSLVIFLIGFVEFSVRDRQLKSEVLITQPERLPAEDMLILDVSMERFLFHDPLAHLSDINLDDFRARLHENDTRNTISEVAFSELDQINLLLSAGTAPDEFVAEVEGLDSSTTRPVLTIVAELHDNVIAEEFVNEFEQIRFVESVIDAGDRRYILNMDEGANVENFARGNAALNNASRSVEVVELTELNLVLEEGSDILALAASFEDREGVEAVMTSLVSRLTLSLTEAATTDRVIEVVETTFAGYFPRANLMPSLWLPTVAPDPGRVLRIGSLDTGIALFVFTLVFAVVEGGLSLVSRGQSEKLIRPLVRVAAVFLVFWSFFGHRPFWDFILGGMFPTSTQLLHPTATVIRFAGQHLELVIISSIITVTTGLITGVVVTREGFREFLPLINNIVNSGQTVPTLAIIAIMAPIIGFGFWPAIIALVLYGLLPVVRNTIVGLEGVDAFIIDSARGMGMTPSQILLQIELPIASRVIMAGVRTSMVINVGTATLGAFVGSGGLGVPIASGLSMTVDAFVLLGALPAALLAILIDYILGRIEFVVTPSGLQIEN